MLFSPKCQLTRLRQLLGHMSVKDLFITSPYTAHIHLSVTLFLPSLHVVFQALRCRAHIPAGAV